MKNYSTNFWLLCAAIFLFMTSFNIILPELNDFLELLGNKSLKGLIITLFTISALISRPFSGKISDLSGRKSTMYVGIFMAGLVTLLYPVVGSVWFFFLLRFAHGFSAGFLPTGATALVTDILPSDKRGQGMGVFGVAISLGIGVGQYLGTPLRSAFGYNGMFYISAGFVLASALIIFTVKETLKNTKKFHITDLKVQNKDLIEWNVLPAGIVMFLSASTSGMLFVLAPDLSEYLGIENKGAFFSYYVLSTIAVRLFTGKTSDRIGRRESLIIGAIFLIISMVLMAFAKTEGIFIVAAIIFGIATGINSPTLFAWMADLSPSNRRGIGSGTLFIALELGIMAGSAFTILLYDSTYQTVPLVFTVATIMSSLSLAYLIWHLKYKENETAN